MPSTFTRPHSAATAHTVGGTDATRQARPYVHTSTTATHQAGVDLLAVERVVNGDRPLPTLNEAEQQVAARLMTDQGHPATRIAAHLGIEARTVSRWRTTWKNGEQS